jgi:hypothetical protein
MEVISQGQYTAPAERFCMWVFSIVHGLMLVVLAMGMFLADAALRLMPGDTHHTHDNVDAAGKAAGVILIVSLLYSTFVPVARRRLDLISLAGSFVTTAILILMGLVLWKVAGMPLIQGTLLVVPYLLFGLAPGLTGWRTAEPEWMRRFPPSTRE